MFTTLAAVLALSTLTLAAPTQTPTPLPLGISLSTDAHCSTLTSGTPTSLVNGTCYPVTSGFSSMDIYAPPTQGLLTVYGNKDCVEGGDTQYFSTEYMGCLSLGSVGRAIRYTAVVCGMEGEGREKDGVTGGGGMDRA